MCFNGKLPTPNAHRPTSERQCSPIYRPARPILHNLRHLLYVQQLPWTTRNPPTPPPTIQFQQNLAGAFSLPFSLQHVNCLIDQFNLTLIQTLGASRAEQDKYLLLPISSAVNSLLCFDLCKLRRAMWPTTTTDTCVCICICVRSSTSDVRSRFFSMKTVLHQLINWFMVCICVIRWIFSRFPLFRVCPFELIRKSAQRTVWCLNFSARPAICFYAFRLPRKVVLEICWHFKCRPFWWIVSYNWPLDRTRISFWHRSDTYL